VAAPSVEREQALGHQGYALLVFAVPLLLSALVEGLLSLLSERVPSLVSVRLGLCVLSGSLVLCALVESGVLLSLGLALAGASSGLACAAAQAALVASPLGSERAMARWVLFGALGDVLSPLLVAGLLHAGGSYRTAFGFAAAWASCVALAANGSVGPDPPRDPDALAEDEVPLRHALRRGAGHVRLWVWLLGAGACTLLDEIVLALAALRVRSELGFSEAAAAVCATGLSLGGVVGAWATERLLERCRSKAVLLASAVVCLAALVAVVLAPSIGWMAFGLVLLGLGAAPQYALLKARAYAALPGRPGVVNALSQVFVVLDIAGPLALGALADAQGLQVALACLALQPIVVVWVVVGLERGASK
jgi:MFS family permease